MKKVSLTDIKIARKWALPAGIIALGFASIAVGQSGTNGSKATVKQVSSQAQSSETPAPTIKPKISINGQEVPTDKKGSTTVKFPGGKAKVEVSGGNTRVTTSASKEGGTENTQSGNVDVKINSQTSGGNSRRSTQIHGFSRSSSNSTTSGNNITIFSTDSIKHTNVSH